MTRTTASRRAPGPPGNREVDPSASRATRARHPTGPPGRSPRDRVTIRRIIPSARAIPPSRTPFSAFPLLGEIEPATPHDDIYSGAAHAARDDGHTRETHR